MRLSSKTAYGVQALFDLAFHGEGRAVQARETAERQGIPLRYLEQILQELRRAGLIEAKRGPGGGYALARAPQAVPLSDVVRALEGSLETRLCHENGAEPGEGEPGERSLDVPALVFRELFERFEALLASVTLKDLTERAETMGLARAAPAPQMYFI